MDPLFFIILCAAVIIASIATFVNVKKIPKIINYLLGLLIFSGIAAIIATIASWSSNGGQENLIYHYVGKIPFEYNPSDQEYYIYHEDKFKNSSESVYAFSKEMLNNPDYDSCYVYKVETPTFLWFLNNQKWHHKYKYRQSRDILLEHRTIDKVSIHEREN